MRPETKREWGFLAAGAALSLLILVILGTHYTLAPMGGGLGGAFLMDNWTGEVWRCTSTCGHH